MTNPEELREREKFFAEQSPEHLPGKSATLQIILARLLKAKEEHPGIRLRFEVWSHPNGKITNYVKINSNELDFESHIPGFDKMSDEDFWDKMHEILDSIESIGGDGTDD